MHLPLIIIPFVAVILLLILIFEVWMFIDALQNPRLTDTERIIWCIGMFLVHPIVAIIYYFFGRNPRRA